MKRKVTMKGSELKRLRASRGLTQEALATELGYSPGSVCAWENDTMTMSDEAAAKINGFFGLTESPSPFKKLEGRRILIAKAGKHYIGIDEEAKEAVLLG